MTNKLSRRDLLQQSLIAAAALSLPAAATAVAGDKQWPGLKDSIIINNLGGIDNPNLWIAQQQDKLQASSDRLQTLDSRALKDLQQSGTTALNLTLGYVAGPMEPFEHSVAEIAKWNQLIAQNSKMLCKVLTAEDIVNAKKDSKVGVIFGFQNAAMLGSDAQRAAIFAGLGVRIVQLTYNVRNQLGDGSMVAENKGLTAFGHECVEALNANNLVIDLSHSGEQTCLDAIAASKRPICISHTGCRALSDLPRNKSDKELRLLADKGGVVGIYFMPFLKEDSFPNAMDVVRHIEHAINICGEDHVGIGTDGGTTRIDDMQAFHRLIDAEVEQRQKAGISAKGEKKGVVPMIPDLQGPEQFQQLADMLYRRGHSSTRIEKILGGNFLRLNRDIWGA
jgi:membrane dipeptidase